MSKKDAAAFLEVSPRALERYTQQGRLSVRHERGKTRPVPVYDDAELTQFREELNRQRTRRAVPQSESMEGVGFRLDAFYRQQLETRGAAEGLSAGEYARRLVVRALEDPAGESVTRDLAALREEMTKLRADMASSLEMILLNLTAAKPEEIKAWVSQHLRR